jgi:hypothetical protein
MTCTVRPTRPGDADAISEVIVQALTETNSRDYAPEIIARLTRSFTPDAVKTLMVAIEHHGRGLLRASRLHAGSRCLPWR